MKRALNIAKLVVLVLLAAFLLAVTIAVCHLDSEMLEIAQKVASAIDHGVVLENDADDRVNELHGPISEVPKIEAKAEALEDQASAVGEWFRGSVGDVLAHAVPVEDAALERVNQLQVPITDSGKLLTDARVAVSNANKAAIDERFYFEQQAPATFERLNKVIDGALPIEANVAATTGSWAAMSANGEKVVDKETTDFLKPVPWYMKPVKRFGEIWDIAAAAARHVP